MKKLFLVLFTLFQIASFAQPQTFTGVKTFSSPPTFLNLNQGTANDSLLVFTSSGTLKYYKQSDFISGVPNYWTKTGDDITNNNIGKVGIGITPSSGKLEILSTALGKALSVKNSDNANIESFYVNGGGSVHCGFVYPTGYVQFNTNGYGLLMGGNASESYFKGYQNNRWESDLKIKYATDLSASYDDRTLVDKGYVSSLLNVNRDFKYPADYTFRPFKIFELNGRFYPDKSVKDLVKDKMSKMKPYYLNYTTGLDANDGLTAATAVKTLAYALSIGAQLIYLADGDIIKNDGFGGINNLTYGNKDIFLVSKGRTKVINSIASLSFALDTGTTYVADISSATVPNVVDFKFVNEYGFPLALLKKGTLAEVNATGNTYFITGTSLYVNLKDNRVPDTQVHALKITTDNYFSSQGSEYIYCENISFIGGNAAFTLRGASTTGSNINGLFNNCYYMYANQNGYQTTTTGGMTWSENCISFDNGRDGFNYSQNTMTTAKMIEVNCTAFNNGVHTSDLTSALNGSSVHNKFTALRVNGKYFRNVGPNVIDVNGALSLNVGVECFDSIGFDDTAVNPTSAGVNWADWGDFAVGTIATESASKMWLYGCISKDTQRSYSTPVFLQGDLVSDDSVIYTDKSTFIGPIQNNVIDGAFTTGNVAEFVFPALSVYTIVEKANVDSQTFTGTVVLPSTTTIGTVSNTEIGYLDNVTSAIQAQLDAKGTVTSTSVVSANGFAGSVATSTTTPAITLSTTVTGLLKGNGTAISAAVSNTDYIPASGAVFANAFTITGGSGSSILRADGAAISTANTVRAVTAGTDTASSAIITSVSPLNGVAWQLQNQLINMTAYVAKTSTYTATALDSFIDCTSGTFTVTLPTAVGIKGKRYTVKNSGAGIITLATTSGQTIDDVTTKTLSTQWSNYQVVSDDFNWKIVSALP